MVTFLVIIVVTMATIVSTSFSLLAVVVCCGRVFVGVAEKESIRHTDGEVHITVVNVAKGD